MVAYLASAIFPGWASIVEATFESPEVGLLSVPGTMTAAGAPDSWEASVGAAALALVAFAGRPRPLPRPVPLPPRFGGMMVRVV